jgi:hypothetical protein
MPYCSCGALVYESAKTCYRCGALLLDSDEARATLPLDPNERLRIFRGPYLVYAILFGAWLIWAIVRYFWN